VRRLRLEREAREACEATAPLLIGTERAAVEEYGEGSAAHEFLRRSPGPAPITIIDVRRPPTRDEG
jgi:hypothetical protein